jgi:hypothetical protein
VIPLKALLTFFFLVLVTPFAASAGVVVHDDIAITGETAMLKAETRGRFFPKGGVLVEFRVNGGSLGSALSGGDGVAFREFTPRRSGLYAVEAVSGEEKATGHVLSLKRGSGIVFVDVENGVFENIFSKAPRSGSRDAITEIMKGGNVVYLSTEIFGSALSRQRLRENEFPDAPLLKWDQGAVFHAVVEMGLKVRAVIGSPAFVESAGEFKPRAFSFGEAEGAVEVEEWSGIPEKL